MKDERIQFVLVKALILAVVIAFSLCQRAQTDQNDSVVICQTGSGMESVYSSTTSMIQKLWDAVSNIDVARVPYILNGRKVELLERELLTVSGMQKTQVQFNYGNELMRSGKTVEALEVIEDVLEVVETLNPKTNAKKRQKGIILFAVKKQLALAYMRMGEQDNCINNL